MKQPAIAALAIVLAGAAAHAQEVTVFRNVNVIPMDSERVLAAQTVVVRGERIESIAEASRGQIPAGARVVDGTGRYLVPGLAEMHAHVPEGDERYVEEVLFLYVANGVTTARGMLGAPVHLALRERLARHEVLGPRLYTSGPSVNDQSVNSPDDAARIVRFINNFAVSGKLSRVPYPYKLSDAEWWLGTWSADKPRRGCE